MNNFVGGRALGKTWGMFPICDLSRCIVCTVGIAWVQKRGSSSSPADSGAYICTIHTWILLCTRTL